MRAKQVEQHMTQNLASQLILLTIQQQQVQLNMSAAFYSTEMSPAANPCWRPSLDPCLWLSHYFFSSS